MVLPLSRGMAPTRAGIDSPRMRGWFCDHPRIIVPINDTESLYIFRVD
jgi:hypothetical protein